MSLTVFAAVLALACGPTESLPMGEEKFGNEPVANQKEWAPGVLAAANDLSRVYRRWVNGNEDFCYRGDANKCNRVINLFASIKDEKKTLVLMPTQGVTFSFKKIEVKHDWRLHVPSGIYLHIAKRETDHPVLAQHPSLTIHLGGALKIEDLKIPAGMVVVGPEKLVEKYRAGFTSTAKRTRGQACYLMKDFGWYPGVVEDLVKVLEGEDSWMRVNALSALRVMAADAKPAVLVIEKLKMRVEEQPTKDACDLALKAINGAELPKKDSRRALEKVIRVWLKGRDKK